MFKLHCIITIVLFLFQVIIAEAQACPAQTLSLSTNTKNGCGVPGSINVILSSTWTSNVSSGSNITGIKVLFLFLFVFLSFVLIIYSGGKHLWEYKNHTGLNPFNETWPITSSGGTRLIEIFLSLTNDNNYTVVSCDLMFVFPLVTVTPTGM